MKKLVGLVVALLAACAAVPLMGAAAFFGGGGGGAGCAATLGTSGPAEAPLSQLPAIDGFDTEQVSNVVTILNVGSAKGVPPWGWVIAVATALQESGLRNPAGGADDSIGLFQQRPSQGWGTAQQLADPGYQAGKFFDKLLTIPGWEELPPAEAAQRVQVSAYPDAYAKHTDAATRLVNQVATALGLPAISNECTTGQGWTQPVHAPIVSGFRTPQRPSHDGVDLGARRGTPVQAASAGTVTVVRCNVVPESHGCDIDGSPQIPGCGWYVDIEHTGGVVTRYCHMLTRPIVQEGQYVNTGQVIGLVGSSGHSSGPHLHYEVHIGSHASDSAIDPVNFMEERGVPLGS
jgi:murein DD-endopeptidase MepM/ murein hydrolase activator NlpD